MAKSLKDLDSVAKEYDIGGKKGDFFKLEQGDNRVRVVSGYEVLAKHWANGKMLGICIGKEKGCPWCNAPVETDPKTGKPKDMRPNVRFLMWVIDRQDENKMKLAEFGWSIVNSMRELSQDEEYGYDSEIPPYDMNIKKTVKNGGKNPSDTEYTVIAARTNTPLTDEEKGEIAGLTPIETVVDRIKVKAGAPSSEEAETAEETREEISEEDFPLGTN